MESIVQQLRRRPIVALRHFLMDLSSAGDFFPVSQAETVQQLAQ